MCEFSNFPAYQQTADLYMMDVKTGKYERLAANSDEAESWHAWSSNSRWIVFTSKRSEGYLARPYFSYIDEAGKAHKPLLLPQKDPAFYESYTRIFNLPQLARGRVRLTPRKIVRALHARDRQFKATLDPKVKPRPPERLPDTGPSRFE